MLVEESRSFARKVKDVGVEVEAVEPPQGNHAFDLALNRSKDFAGLEKMVAFLLKTVK